MVRINIIGHVPVFVGQCLLMLFLISFLVCSSIVDFEELIIYNFSVLSDLYATNTFF